MKSLFVAIFLALFGASFADTEPAKKPAELRPALSFEAYDCATLNSDANTIERVAIDFSVYRGKIVILHFWNTASNNGMLRVGSTVLYPAIDEMRFLKRFADKHPEVVFLAVHLFTEDPNAVKLVLTALFGEKYPQSFGFALGDRDTWPLMDNYKNFVLPATFFIDRTGKIVVSRDGTLDWENNPNIEKLVKELLSR